jgi:single-strand selective monofunctional uracil DNA glycosylase
LALSRTSQALVQAARKLVEGLSALKFSEPVHTVYNPLEYAWQAHRQYLDRFAAGPKKVLFLGMNPGPWGMAQTGVPFGEIQAVREFLQIDAKIGKPQQEHPKRPIHGLDCQRSEVSGKRMWGLFQERFGTPSAFFAEHFVANYCPLVFMDSGARNLTPDKLPSLQSRTMFQQCDEHLVTLIKILQPTYLVGVGQFAQACLQRVSRQTGSLDPAAGEGGSVKILRILHPSPASPAANRGWSTAVEKTLVEHGIWEEKTTKRI